jgi:hypothetical protein
VKDIVAPSVKQTFALAKKYNFPDYSKLAADQLFNIQ